MRNSQGHSHNKEEKKQNTFIQSVDLFTKFNEISMFRASVV
jgi:hypothetical protein